MATRKELIANQRTVADIRELLGVDTLGYLSIEGLRTVIGVGANSHCDACFTGEYPIPVQLEMDKLAFELDSVVEKNQRSQDWDNQSQRR